MKKILPMIKSLGEVALASTAAVALMALFCDAWQIDFELWELLGWALPVAAAGVVLCKRRLAYCIPVIPFVLWGLLFLVPGTRDTARDLPDHLVSGGEYAIGMALAAPESVLRMMQVVCVCLAALFSWSIARNRMGWLAGWCIAGLVWVSADAYFVNRAVVALVGSFVLLGLMNMAWRWGGRTREKSAVVPPRPPFPMVAAAGLTAVLVGLTCLAYPNTEPVMPLRGLQRTMSKLDGFFADYGGFVVSREGFSFRGVGVGAHSTKLGGDVYLSDAVDYTVRGVPPPLLVGSRSNDYTGSAWVVSLPQRGYRFDALTPRQRTAAFGLDEPEVTNETAAWFLRYDCTVVSAQKDRTGTILSAERVTKAEILDVDQDGTSMDFVQLYYSDMGEMFIIDPTVRGMQVHLESRGLTRANLDDMVSYTANTTVDASTRAVLAQYYTQLPNLTDHELEVYDQAIAQATAGATNPLLQMIRLETYLKTAGFTYTTTPGDPGPGDFVARFLESREGYCTYYATAMAALARRMGLPSRYVEGYRVPAPENGRISLRGHDAHAWVEVHLPGLGWVAFDPTPSSDDPAPELTPTPDYSVPPLPVGTPTPARRPTATPDAADETPGATARRTTPTPGATSTAAPSQATARKLPWWPFAVPIGLALLAALRVAWVRRKWNFDRLCAKGARGAGLRMIEGILRALAKVEHTPAVGETLPQFAARCDKWMQKPGCAEAFAIAVRMQYAGGEPSDEDLRVLHDCLMRARREVRNLRGGLAFFWMCTLDF